MSQYRRNLVAGGAYFFTVVTADRRPILTTPVGRACLRYAIHTVRKKHPFTVFSCTLLPDHLHAVWFLPADDARYPLRWRRIKEVFTRTFLSSGGQEAVVSARRAARHERGVWQRRYWEHTIRDDDDLRRCVDYCHWNPVKHGHVSTPRDWPWSTYHRFVASGDYEERWGQHDPAPGFEYAGE
ncbi:MAG: transposase [Planctomyces sp.]|nr:transposase [Planctomyces sp.]